jgi:aminomethyltransferase
MNRTPFYQAHVDLGAKMIDFGGWDMPVQFKGILAEHAAVRERAGVFDISHMGQVWVDGPGARGYLQRLLTNDVAGLPPGKGQYNLMCREDGGVIDDLYVYCLEPDRFLVIVNASRAVVDLQWMQDVAARQRPGLSDGARSLQRPGMPSAPVEAPAGGKGSEVAGGFQILEQPQRAALALQGPRAEKILAAFSGSAAGLPRNGVGEFSIFDMDFVVARTGYTGEDGFELFSPAGHLLQLYPKLLQAGAEHGLEPCGLGARDTLRLEMGYRLYGNDLDEQHTALEAGLGWAVKLEKAEDFIGKDGLLREKKRGPSRSFIAFRAIGAGVPRHGYPIKAAGRVLGSVTSGTFSPSLKQGIGMGYVDTRPYSEATQAGAALSVEVHGRDVPIELVKPPFYRKEAAVL